MHSCKAPTSVCKAGQPTRRRYTVEAEAGLAQLNQHLLLRIPPEIMICQRRQHLFEGSAGRGESAPSAAKGVAARGVGNWVLPQKRQPEVSALVLEISTSMVSRCCFCMLLRFGLSASEISTHTSRFMAHAHARWTEHRTGMFRHKLVINEEIRSGCAWSQHDRC